MTAPRLHLMRDHAFSEEKLRERAQHDPNIRAEVEAELRACDEVIASRGHSACVITSKYAEILRRVLTDG